MADLGPIPPSFHSLGSHGQHSHQHIGPSYERRQKRRKAAGKATNHVDKLTVKVGDVLEIVVVDEAAKDDDTSATVAGEKRC